MSAAGRLIRIRRTERGWSQTHLAKRVGCSVSLIALLENGYSRGLGPVYAREMGKALDVPAKQLVSR